MTDSQQPLAAGESTDQVGEFIRDLRVLKVRAGKPSLQELQKRSGIARSTLSDALNPGRRELPRLEVCLALVRACGVTAVEERGWRDRWQRIALSRDRRAEEPRPEEARPEENRPREEAPHRDDGPPRRSYLPPGLADFTAREPECAEILSLVDSSAADVPAVLVVDGMAGVGKTVLAVQMAHRLAHRFPDGQFYLDLHGYTPGQSPIDPAAALDLLLRANGRSPDGIPYELQARSGVWRAELAGRRALLVLDNAATADQIRPLLPGTGGNLVLVTSRRRLTGLDGAVGISLALLSAEEAAALFRRVLGPRADAEPEQVAEVVELCGRLPLAVRIAAARLRHRESWSVADLAERLRGERRRLAELTTAELAVATSFQTSFQQLGAAERQAFALLGLQPGADVATDAAGALFDRPVEDAEASLELLLDAHMVEQRQAGRYTMHDLLRIHGAAQAAELPESDRERALRRLADHYLQRASLAMDAVHPHERYRRPDVKVPASGPRGFEDAAAAVRWLDAERANLVQISAVPGLARHAIDLSGTLARYLERGAHHREALGLHGRALDLARAAGDRRAEASALACLGLTHLALRDYPQARVELERCLEILCEQDVDATLLTATLNNLGAVSGRLGDLSAALDWFGQAVSRSRAHGDEANEAVASGNLGLIHRRLGQFEAARGRLEEALAIYTRLGNKAGQSVSHDNLGVLNRILGRPDEALEHHRLALVLDREANDRTGEAITIDNLGLVHLMRGDLAKAVQHFETALALARELQDRSSEGIALGNIGTVLRLQGDLKSARGHHEQALALFQASDEGLNRAEALNNLGETLQALAEPGRALPLHREALELAETAGDPVETARSRELLGRVLLDLGHDQEGGQELTRAQTAYQAMGLPRIVP